MSNYFLLDFQKRIAEDDYGEKMNKTLLTNTESKNSSPFGQGLLSSATRMTPQAGCCFIKRNLDGTFAIGHCGIQGEQNNKWKGDKVGYASKHAWIRRHYGKADHCEFNPSHTSRHYEWCNISRKYKRDRKDFVQLCRSCHRFMDKGDYCSRGHRFTPENTWMRKNGWRVCKICLKMRTVDYVFKKRKAG